jgi:glucosamine-6-phosphate deaminase
MLRALPIATQEPSGFWAGEDLMEVLIRENKAEGLRFAAGIIARQVRTNPRCVLGLATGNTMVGVYQELVRLHEAGLDFSQVRSFNLDEYVGLAPDHPSSYHYFMRQHLFSKVAFGETHIPDGLAPDPPTCCDDYERKIKSAGGIDLQLLGLGEDGHIGFNEPTSSLSSRTRIKTLTPVTRSTNALEFPPGETIPAVVLTMGVGTIMDARHCLLLAFGPKKAAAVQAMVEGPVSAMCPASALQYHNRCTVILDQEAASQLTMREYFKAAEAGKPDWQKRLLEDR